MDFKNLLNINIFRFFIVIVMYGPLDFFINDKFGFIGLVGVEFLLFLIWIDVERINSKFKFSNVFDKKNVSKWLAGYTFFYGIFVMRVSEVLSGNENAIYGSMFFLLIAVVFEIVFYHCLKSDARNSFSE